MLPLILMPKKKIVNPVSFKIALTRIEIMKTLKESPYLDSVLLKKGKKIKHTV